MIMLKCSLIPEGLGDYVAVCLPNPGMIRCRTTRGIHRYGWGDDVVDSVSTNPPPAASISLASLVVVSLLVAIADRQDCYEGFEGL